jgi:apolipoprotein N-acyltransferase
MLGRLARLRGWRADAAALAAGGLSAAALPPVHLLPALLVAVPALIALVDGAGGPAVAARRGWWFGFGHHLLGLYWITEAILIEAARFWWFVPIAVPALAAVLALFIAGPAALAWYAATMGRRLAVLAAAWVLADLARQFVATGFPWNPWGSVWAIPGVLGDMFIQPAAWVGEPGLTLATLLLAALPCLGRRGWLAGAVVLLAWAAFGVGRIAGPRPAAPGFQIVLVQGNVAQGQKWDAATVGAIFQRYLDLTEEGVAKAGAGPKVVVWPETASPFLLQADVAAREAIARAADRAPALVGSVRFDARNRPRNSLVAILPDGTVGGLYDKWHLVPFGEFEPSWFPLAIQVVPGGGFGGGEGPETLRIPRVPPFGPLICYEAVYPGQMVQRDDRPAWLVNITNDAWFGYSSGPRQHLAAARLRAVEEGLPLMRAANTGISAGFDARGHELGRLDLGATGVLVLPLPGPLPPTAFSKFGLWIPMAISLGMLVASLRGRRTVITV